MTREENYEKQTHQGAVGQGAETRPGWWSRFLVRPLSRILHRIRGAFHLDLARLPAPDGDESQHQDESIDLENPFPDTVLVEFTDVIDLHSIPPAQIGPVVEDFLAHAQRRGFQWVRIIHGKGIGVQRETVRSILSRTPFVVAFRDAPPEAGGWGATLVTLGKRPPTSRRGNSASA